MIWYTLAGAIIMILGVLIGSAITVSNISAFFKYSNKSQ